MITKADMPKAEAKVIIRNLTDGVWGPWRDALDFDPIMIPVDKAGLADVFHGPLMSLVDNLEDLTGYEMALVWSGSGHPVKGVCPVCDDFFIVHEGFNGDELNEGVDAVCCGCDPRDSFNG